ncbi:MAG: NADPH-dependent FMN reductase [Bacteroidota bacterium]
MSLKKILAISGSTRKDSVNSQILHAIKNRYAAKADFIFYDAIDQLPHFNTELDKDPLPPSVIAFRKQISEADGVLICTPEYVFSLPGSFKNAIEWTVSTTLFTDKPAALITASSSGQKAHEALNLVMRTVGVRLGQQGSLLISAPKTKINMNGEITDTATASALAVLMDEFLELFAES